MDGGLSVSPEDDNFHFVTVSVKDPLMTRDDMMAYIATTQSCFFFISLLLIKARLKKKNCWLSTSGPYVTMM